MPYLGRRYLPRRLARQKMALVAEAKAARVANPHAAVPAHEEIHPHLFMAELASQVAPVHPHPLGCPPMPAGDFFVVLGAICSGCWGRWGCRGRHFDGHILSGRQVILLVHGAVTVPPGRATDIAKLVCAA